MTPDDARRLAASLALEDASSERALSFLVAGRQVAWSWMERVHPKKPRVPRLEVLAVRVRAELKDILLGDHPDRYVADPHYAGYPAVLVRLAAVDESELAALLEEGRRVQAKA